MFIISGLLIIKVRLGSPQSWREKRVHPAAVSDVELFIQRTRGQGGGGLVQEPDVQAFAPQSFGVDSAKRVFLC